MTAPDWAHRALDEIETDDPRTFAEIISALDDHAQRRFHADQQESGMTDIATKVAQLAQLRQAISDMETAAKALSVEIAAEMPQGGLAAGMQVSVAPSRRFDEDKALDLLARAPQQVRERCVTTVSREVVDRNKPRVNDALFELAPADGIAVDSAHRREAIEQPECACTRTAGAPPENTEVQHQTKQAARLAIADPPYPPRTCADGSRIARASRWYGDGQHSRKDSPADFHPDAARWDDPTEHRRLLEHLDATYDGWAIATTPDGLSAYGELPPAARTMAWVKRNGAAGSHRIRGCWEAVIVSPPPGRRGGNGLVEDVLIAGRPNAGFVGAKPTLWVTWVLAALGHDPEIDTVDDLFPGTGIVSRIASQGVLSP